MHENMRKTCFKKSLSSSSICVISKVYKSVRAIITGFHRDEFRFILTPLKSAPPWGKFSAFFVLFIKNHFIWTCIIWSSRLACLYNVQSHMYLLHSGCVVPCTTCIVEVLIRIQISCLSGGINIVKKEWVKVSFTRLRERDGKLTI